jgi:hypothetical protein
MPVSRTTRWPPPQGWYGYDCDTTCNLCAIWRPSERSDERLLAMADFAEFAFVASNYRTWEQGRALLRRWVERHGGDFERLRRRAMLPSFDRTPEEIAQHERERAERAAAIEAKEREDYEREERES